MWSHAVDAEDDAAGTWLMQAESSKVQSASENSMQVRLEEKKDRPREWQSSMLGSWC